MDLAAEIADLELHASSVHLQAEELEGAGWDRVDTEAKGVQQIDRNLRVANRLSLAARHQNDVVDLHNTADAEPTQVLDCRLQKLGRDSGCWGDGRRASPYIGTSHRRT